MKLALDEMISATVAEQPRGRDRDVEAVRSIVTYNRDNFLELDRLYRGGNRRLSLIHI